MAKESDFCDMDLDALKAALVASPDNVPLLLLTATAYQEKFELEESAKLIAKAMELDPDNAQGHVGLGMALGMAEAGAAIVVVGRDGEKNRLAVGEIEATGAAAHAVVADITSEADCAAMVA